MIVLFISIFFQSVAILFIKYSRDGNQVALERSFKSSYMASSSTTSAQDGTSSPASDRGGAKLLNTIASVLDNLGDKPDDQSKTETAPDKIVVSVKRNSTIEQFKPEVVPPVPQAPAVAVVQPAQAQTRQVTTYVNGKNEVVEIPYGHKIIFHTLSYGERLSDIARMYNSSLDSIKNLNGFKENYRIYVGQKIMVVKPTEEKTPAPKVAAAEPAKTENTRISPVTEEKNTVEEAKTTAPAISEKTTTAFNDDISNILRSSRGIKNISQERAPSVKAAPASTEATSASTSKDPLADIIKSAKKKRRVFKWPVRGEVSSKFGMRIHPVYGETAFHTGIDIAAYRGRSVTPAMGGKVVFAGWMGGYGRMIEVRHPKGYTTKYAHLSKIRVKQGQDVTSSTVIGNVGDTGTSTGYHLHFEVRKSNKPLNPLAFIQN